MNYDKNLARLDGERESGVRAKLTLLCEVRQGTKPWTLVRLEDLSSTGFRITWLPNHMPDRPLRIRIPGIQILNANIRWSEGNTLGCSFENPLHIAVFEHLVSKSVMG